MASSKVALPSASVLPSFSAMFSRSRLVVEHTSLENESVDVHGNGNLIFLKDCRSCKFNVSGSASKVIIENCRSCDIELGCRVVSGTVEIINSSLVNCHVTEKIPSITVDKSKSVRLVIQSWPVDVSRAAVYSSHCEDISVVIPQFAVNHSVPSSLIATVSDTYQCITWMVNNEIVSEDVVRCGGGYVTTAREKKITDEKEARALSVLKESMSSLLQQRPASKQRPASHASIPEEADDDEAFVPSASPAAPPSPRPATASSAHGPASTKAIAHAPLKAALQRALRLAARPVREHVGAVGEERSVDATGSSLLLVRGCRDSVFHVSGRVTKVAVENCHNCRFNLDCVVVSGTLELINCNSLHCVVALDIPSITVDASDNTTLEFPSWSPNPRAAVYTAKSANVTVRLTDRAIVHAVPATSEDQQVVTWMVDSNLSSERAVRCGAGYVTTEREKKVADEKEARAMAVLQESMASLVKISGTTTKRRSPLKSRTSANAAAVPDAGANNANKSSSKGLLSSVRNFAKQCTLRPTTTTVRSVSDMVGSCGQQPSTPQGRRPQYGHGAGEDVTEYFDTPEDLKAKVKALADEIRSAGHVVVYTGAGISTSARLPDYRGPNGVWTMRDQGKVHVGGVTLEQALPTRAHMAIASLVAQGVVNFVVSTNVDGLHRRSGVPGDRLAELHGNCYLEQCRGCAKDYARTFDVTRDGCRPDHLTGRVCDCGAPLTDSIINFGEPLPQGPLRLAAEHSKKSDLAIVVGTSMRVQPAASLPTLAARMVIVNLQKTPEEFEQQASLRLFSRTDDVFELLARELGVAVPEYDEE